MQNNFSDSKNKNKVVGTNIKDSTMLWGKKKYVLSKVGWYNPVTKPVYPILQQLDQSRGQGEQDVQEEKRTTSLRISVLSPSSNNLFCQNSKLDLL